MSTTAPQQITALFEPLFYLLSPNFGDKLTKKGRFWRKLGFISLAAGVIFGSSGTFTGLIGFWFLAYIFGLACSFEDDNKTTAGNRVVTEFDNFTLLQKTFLAFGIPLALILSAYGVLAMYQ